MKCPNCGNPNLDGDKCPNCGVLVTNFLISQINKDVKEKKAAEAVTITEERYKKEELKKDTGIKIIIWLERLLGLIFMLVGVGDLIAFTVGSTLSKAKSNLPIDFYLVQILIGSVFIVSGYILLRIKKGQHFKRFVLAIGIIIGVLIIGGGWLGISVSEHYRNKANSQECLVTYQVTGTAKWASLTYENNQGGTEQISGVDLPWEKSYKTRKGQYLYISAQNGTDSGSIRAEILLNGQPWKTSESSGGYTIASCNGSAGRE